MATVNVSYQDLPPAIQKQYYKPSLWDNCKFAGVLIGTAVVAAIPALCINKLIELYS